MGEKKKNLVTKKEAFENDPNRFLDTADIIMGVIQSKDEQGRKGVGIYISNQASRLVITSAIFDLQREVQGFITEMDLAAAHRQKSDIIVPGDNGGNGKPKNRM
jgi:hypothetical protein